MPGPITAANVISDARVLLNDTKQQNYTDAVMIPFVNMAIRELNKNMELNGVSPTRETSSVLLITTVMTDIGGSTGPALPSDLIEISELWERTQGVTEDYIPMIRVNYLPPITELVESLVYWAFEDQIIKFVGALTNREVKIDYIGQIVPEITQVSDNISLFNSRDYLAQYAAGLAAFFIGENDTRAMELKSLSDNSLDDIIGISVKGDQVIPARRRPFMASYKARGGY